MKRKSPVTTAKELLAYGCTIEEYERLQSRRRERLELWKEKNVTALIGEEEKLIAFGEEVLKFMK